MSFFAFPLLLFPSLPNPQFSSLPFYFEYSSLSYFCSFNLFMSEYLDSIFPLLLYSVSLCVPRNTLSCCYPRSAVFSPPSSLKRTVAVVVVMMMMTTTLLSHLCMFYRVATIVIVVTTSLLLLFYPSLPSFFQSPLSFTKRGLACGRRPLYSKFVQSDVLCNKYLLTI